MKSRVIFTVYIDPAEIYGVDLAYRGSDAKGAINIPLGLHALVIGLILIVSQLGAAIDLWSIEMGNTVGGLGFLLIVIWSVNRGLALMNSK